MLKKLLTVTMLGIGIAVPLLAAGCASDSSNGAYGLTGTHNQLTAQERARYTDQKGHFRPDLVPLSQR